MKKLHYDLVVELRQAVRAARARALVKICNAYLRGDASDADRAHLAEACWRLLGK